jgi:hypothetical protein
MSSAFSLTTFTDTTRKVCSFSAISIFLILLTIATPLNQGGVLSGIMKMIILVLLAYTIYLNILQTNSLRMATSSSYEVNNQITINVVSSYVFTLFLGLLALFVAKGMMF